MAYPIYEDSNTLVERPLRRPLAPRMIGGVCAGLAKWLGWDRTVVRLAFVLLGVFTSFVPAAIVYGVLWIVIPEERSSRRRYYDRFEEDLFG